MKKISLKTILVLSFISIPATALAVPGIPHQFYGSVNYSDGPASDGLLVEAKINNTVVASTVVADGKYGYNPNIFFVTDPNNNKTGKTITFFVDGIDTGESEIFENGRRSEKNLTVEETISPPSPPSSPPATGGGGGGGGGGTYSPAASSQSSLSAAAKAVDVNSDNKIDILDFNTLMVNWGNTTVGNIADLDNSNKVDIFDFNLLMVHWTG